MIVLTMIFAVILFSSFTDNNIKLSKIWESESVFMTPESVVFDSLRNCLYVSNFNDKGGFRKRADTISDECISKVDLDGNVIEMRWVDNLLGPCGITIFKDTLYAVERNCLTLINIDKHSIIKRISIDNSDFLNDLAIDKNGNIYVSDTGDNGIIYKITNCEVNVWLQDTLLHNTNGLYMDNDNLIIGNQGNATLLSVS